MELKSKKSEQYFKVTEKKVASYTKINIIERFDCLILILRAIVLIIFTIILYVDLENKLKSNAEEN